MPSTRVNDIELYYEVTGEGAPVLLIPGLGVDINYFSQIIGQLATKHRVVAFDPRGAGRSDKPDEPYTIDGMADDAVGLLAHLAIDRTTVVGCSMGGRIALSLTLSHPELVERLVLAAASPNLPPERFPSRRWLMMNVLSRIPLPKSVDPQPHYAWEHQRRASRGFDVTARLGEIEVPTLVIHGRDDHMVPFSSGQEMADQIHGARLVAVSGGHRALFREHAAQLAEEVDQFMAAS
ncbi:MAG TPA: alpha/beta hydrolase [Acidimicrobiales bacterium]